MEYLLFTYPNCPKCEELKKYLGETTSEWGEYNLVQKESKLKIREFLGVLKRDSKGAIIIPTLVIRNEGGVKAVLNNRQELESWLKSKE
jgi:glutaredoxin